jgi:metal-dependent hydrolase (beta-lactamase superfamily II)
VEFDNEKGEVVITAEELQKLQNTINYLREAVQDVVGGACGLNAKLKYMHECKRIHQLASGLIAELRVRDNQD